MIQSVEASGKPIRGRGGFATHLLEYHLNQDLRTSAKESKQLLLVVESEIC